MRVLGGVVVAVGVEPGRIVARVVAYSELVWKRAALDEALVEEAVPEQ